MASASGSNHYGTAAERIADGAVHAAGILASMIAVPVLLVLASQHLDPQRVAGLAIYGGAIVLLFLTSAAYHLTPRPAWKPALKRLDQAAIFLKIAGTYTPLVVVLGSLFAWVVLAGVWLAAIVGMVGKIALGARFERLSVSLYLPLGWASLLLIWPIFTMLPPAISLLVFAGGVLYTLGVVFHVREKLAYRNAIWHCFVLAASTCHFLAVTMAAFHLEA